jgi:glyoxylase-like metal-dependent hydrolase (beta-lactamase superfamily II)
MRTHRTVSLGLLAIALLLVPAPWARSQQAPVREITKIAGEVYRFRNATHYSVFAVTPVGVIATDPINGDAARCLKAEIAQRFKQPVRYLVYSHDHADHIAGGEVFADTATVVAHEHAKATILGERRPTAVPEVTFSDRLTLELGGTVLELTHVGKNHSDNSMVMRFPRERILFAVDFIPINSYSFRDFPDAYMPDWTESLRRVEAMDFDALAPGHGPLGTRASVTMFREYLQEMKQLITLPKYAASGPKEWFPLNIEGM